MIMLRPPNSPSMTTTSGRTRSILSRTASTALKKTFGTTAPTTRAPATVAPSRARATVSAGFTGVLPKGP